MDSNTKRLAEQILSDGGLFLEGKLPFWQFETSFHENALAVQDLPAEKREALLALDSKLDDTEFGDDEELQRAMAREILDEVVRILGSGA